MFNPLSYIGYQLQNNRTRTAFLMDMARHDPFYGRVVEDLCAFGFDVAYPLRGNVGHYAPNVLDVGGEGFEKGFMESVRRGDMRVRFSFPPLHGRAKNAHLWLHELTHFYQDMHGLFLEPLCVAGQKMVAPDEVSFVEAYVFCEAMAEMEALHGSWRLREAGYPEAWYGAMCSEWRELALLYASEMAVGDEAPTAQVVFGEWYKMNQKAYYEARARRHYAGMIAHLQEGQGVEFCEVPLADVVAMLPAGEWPAYTQGGGGESAVRGGSAAFIWNGLR